MGLLLALVIGALIGWLASLIMRSGRGGALAPILIGIIGSLLGGLVLGPILGGGNLLESELDIRTLPVTLIGAIGLTSLLSFFRRRRAGP